MNEPAHRQRAQGDSIDRQSIDCSAADNRVILIDPMGCELVRIGVNASANILLGEITLNHSEDLLLIGTLSRLPKAAALSQSI